MAGVASKAQLAALKWLRNRNGDGVFERNNRVLVAGGDRAPVMRATWNRLDWLGLVEFYQDRHRLRITDVGRLVNLTNVDESKA